MTLSSATVRSTYAGNGATTVFAIGFHVFDEDEVEVLLVDADGSETVQTLTTHYSVSGVGTATGNVTMVTAPASGQTLVIRSAVPNTQTTDLRNQGPVRPETVETALDRAVRIAQQLLDEIARAIRLPDGETGTDAKTLLPALASRASRFFAWNASGEPIASAGVTEVPWEDALGSALRLVVRVATTTNTTLSGPGANVDGVAMAVGDRVLLAGQTTTSQCGIWIWQGAAVAMTRPSDYNSAGGAPTYGGLEVRVKEGTFAGNIWRCVSPNPGDTITVDTTNTAWIQAPVSDARRVFFAAAVAVANVTIATPGATIDGVAPVSGTDIILLTAQSTASQNGPWIWNGAASAMTRPAWWRFGVAIHRLDAIGIVRGGTVYAQSIWQCTSTATVTIDSDSTAWTNRGSYVPAGNTDTTRRFLRSVGTGAAPGVPTFDTLQAGDLPAASDSAQGAIEIAVQAEMEAGSSTTLAVTPGRLHFHPGACKCWVEFNGTGTPGVVASYGAGTITDNGAGDQTVNWSVTFSSANYCAIVAASTPQAGITSKTTTTTRTDTRNSGGTAADAASVYVACFGDF